LEGGLFNHRADFSAHGDRNESRPEAECIYLANFRKVKFNGKPSRGNFQGMTFENRKYLRWTSFSGALFEAAPKFHGCTLHQDTTFPAVENFKDTESESAASAYRTLKLAMENIRARQEEAMFYSLEEKSLRNRKDRPWSVDLASYLYETFSDYGRSFGLPLFWMFFLTYFCFLFYRDVAQIPEAACLKDVGVFKFTIQQIVRPFEMWRSSSNLSTKNCGGWIALFATLQSLMNFSFIALFLLALRRRFKMD
jgi:hypothetical protein